MRHLTRLYFENTTTTNQFVSLVDQGFERVEPASGPPVFNPLFGIKVGTLSDPMTLDEAMSALQFLHSAPCFFKLPIGAHAVVDLYIPDLIGSDAPKVFDYQVFKAKDQDSHGDRVRTVAEFRERLAKMPAEIFQAKSSPRHQYEGNPDTGEPTGPLSTAGVTGATGPNGGTCCYVSSGPSGPSNPCGGQTCIPCDDVINTRASCVLENGAHVLRCVASQLSVEHKK